MITILKKTQKQGKFDRQEILDSASPPILTVKSELTMQFRAARSLKEWKHVIRKPDNPLAKISHVLLGQ